MLEIRGDSGGMHLGDSFRVYCKKCGQETQNRFLYKDPVVPQFEATCSKCNESGEFRLDSTLWDDYRYQP